MLKTYLNTAENLFLDSAGNFWRDGEPELTIRGKEELIIHLVADSPDHGTAAATPESWQPDMAWSEIPGISAMLTVDNDYRHRVKGSVTQQLTSGSTAAELSFANLSNPDEIPAEGIVTFYSPGGEFESIAYTRREISGKNAVFSLASAIGSDYAAGNIADVKQSPLCTAYLNVEKSDWSTGKLEFDLAVDSSRLRSLTEYSDTAGISIEGVELLLYSTSPETSAVTILRRFLWDTPSLVNTIGDPGFPAPVPDEQKDYIAAEVSRQMAGITPEKGVDYWTEEDKAEIRSYVDEAILNGEW